MTPETSQRIAERLDRLEQQVRSFRELHVTEVTELATKLRTLVELHADELQLILDELTSIAREVQARPAPPAPAGDPAADSPKRAAWLAEQERRAKPGPVSRRELLFGRDEDPGPA